MTIVSLIKQLTGLHEKHGNLDVFLERERLEDDHHCTTELARCDLLVGAAEDIAQARLAERARKADGTWVPKLRKILVIV